MRNNSPTLDYAAAKPRSRLRKWTKRILLSLLILACLYATPLVWLYWGWRQEQPAREMVKRVGGDCGTEACGTALLGKMVPARLAWIRERITKINVTGTSANDDDLRTLQRLSRLKELYLFYTEVTDAGLVHLKGLAGLQALSLESLQISDAGLLYLEGLTGLQWLCLARTQVTDAGLVHLKRLTELRSLILDDTEVTDAGLVHLKGLAGLQRLHLAGTGATDGGVAELEKALPQCEITR